MQRRIQHQAIVKKLTAQTLMIMHTMKQCSRYDTLQYDGLEISWNLLVSYLHGCYSVSLSCSLSDLCHQTQHIGTSFRSTDRPCPNVEPANDLF